MEEVLECLVSCALGFLKALKAGQRPLSSVLRASANPGGGIINFASHLRLSGPVLTCH